MRPDGLPGPGIEAADAVIVCRTGDGLRLVDRMLASGKRLVVASDDAYVLRLARAREGVLDARFLEGFDSLFSVANDVKDLIATLDGRLSALFPDLPRDVVGFGMHVEGGSTSQRVQDLCLLVKSYMGLIADHPGCPIHVAGTPGSEWEDDVLEACARARGVQFRRHSAGVWKRLVGWLDLAARPWAIAAYMLVAEQWIRATARGQRDWSVLDGAIWFQLCGSAPKHVANVVPLMREIEKQGGKSIGICWVSAERLRKPHAAQAVRDLGLSAILLEELLTIRTSFRSIILMLRGAPAGKVLDGMSYEGVPVQQLLGQSVRQHFVVNVPQRYRYDQAIAALLARGKPLAVKSWGGGDLPEGKALLRRVREVSGGNSCPHFFFWVGTGYPWPYSDRDFKPDLFLAKSPDEFRLASDQYGLPPVGAVVTGSPRFDAYTTFASSHSSESSRRALAIPEGFGRYVGFDLSGTLRGFLSQREQHELLQAMLGMADAHAGTMVVVKHHPGFPITKVRHLMDERHRDNVILLPRESSAAHFLNAVDLLVTKFSTLMLEASLLGRPVVSVLLDREVNFRILGDIPSTFWSTAEFVGFMERILGDPLEYESWRRGRTDALAKLLPHYYVNAHEDGAVIAARAVLERCGAPTHDVGVSLSLAEERTQR